MEIAYARSRWGKGSGDDYLNLPLDPAQYRAFVAALVAGEKVAPHGFEEARYFEGCLPIEVMAERGPEVLSYGPMKPVGLDDPAHRTAPARGGAAPARGRGGDRLQPRRLPDAPHLARAAPDLPLLRARPRGGGVPPARPDPPEHLPRRAARPGAGPLRARAAPPLLRGADHRRRGVRRVCGVRAPRGARDPRPARRSPLPGAAARDRDGALHRHLTGEAHPPGYEYQPSNVVYALFPVLDARATAAASPAIRPSAPRLRGKAARKEAYAERARKEIEPWLTASSPPSSS